MQSDAPSGSRHMRNSIQHSLNNNGAGHQIPRAIDASPGVTDAYRHPRLITSGGQSGADIGALKAAKALGVATGGWAPKGWRTEFGPKPSLGRLFHLEQCDSPDFHVRTLMNVVECDAVLLIAEKFDSPGTRLTERYAVRHRKPTAQVQKSGKSPKPSEIERIRKWMDYHQPEVLLVAGNRESVAPGIEAFTFDLIQQLLETDNV